jgi:hypothetical protein
MSHFVSKLGDLLHFHPLAHLLEARKASNIPGRRAPVDAPHDANQPDDLSHLGLRVEHHASDSRSDLGRFALLAKDDAEHQARVDDIWLFVD